MTTWLILALLFIKHFLADFCWQSDRMIKDKGHLGRLGGLQHAGLHGALTYVILMHFLNLQARRATVRLSTDSDKFWMWIGIDQLVHAMVYLMIGFTVSILTAEYI
jgi:hypothetical protein